MIQDGLDKLSTEDLTAKLRVDPSSQYTGNKMILRTAKLAEQQKTTVKQNELQEMQGPGTGLQPGI